jgi:hypothetical protein
MALRRSRRTKFQPLVVFTFIWGKHPKDASETGVSSRSVSTTVAHRFEILTVIQNFTKSAAGLSNETIRKPGVEYI